MKHLFLSAFTMVLAVSALAQDIDVDKKTGLVSVDKKEAFYLVPKSVNMFSNDYSLQNLEHKELAYLKYSTRQEYRRNGTTEDVPEYLMVFTESGNQCTLTGFSLLSGFIKPIAKKIVSANLVQEGAVSATEERKFVVLNKGTFMKGAATPEKVVVIGNGSNDAPKNIPPADISLKESNIYNNSELVGVFRTAEADGMSVISVYNTSDALVCKASHKKGDDSSDWSILSDGKTASILYNPAAPLEKLFKYLVEKGIL